MFFYDTSNVETKNINYDVTGYSILQTTRDNCLPYTKQEIERANKARHYQSTLVWPPLTTYVQYVSQNLLNNCDINVDDIMRAEKIYGPAPNLLKGTMEREKPTSHLHLQKIPLPAHMLSTLRDITLFIDIFYVNRSPFF